MSDLPRMYSSTGAKDHYVRGRLTLCGLHINHDWYVDPDGRSLPLCSTCEKAWARQQQYT